MSIYSCIWYNCKKPWWEKRRTATCLAALCSSTKNVLLPSHFDWLFWSTLLSGVNLFLPWDMRRGCRFCWNLAEKVIKAYEQCQVNLLWLCRCPHNTSNHCWDGPSGCLWCSIDLKKQVRIRREGVEENLRSVREMTEANDMCRTISKIVIGHTLAPWLYA